MPEEILSFDEFAETLSDTTENDQQNASETVVEETSIEDADQSQDLDIPEDYLLEISDEDDDAVKDRLTAAQKAITQKYAKLDNEYKAKLAEIEQREKLYSASEAEYLKALESGIDDADIETLLQLSPKFIEKQKELSSLKEKVRLAEEMFKFQEAEKTANTIIAEVEKLGYTEDEIHDILVADDGKLAKRFNLLLSSGDSVKQALKAIGIEKKLSAPPKNNISKNKQSFEDFAKSLFQEN